MEKLGNDMVSGYEITQNSMKTSVVKVPFLRDILYIRTITSGKIKAFTSYKQKRYSMM